MTTRPFLETLSETVASLSSFPAATNEDMNARYGVSHMHRMHLNESAYGPSPKVLEAIAAAADTLGNYPAMRDDGLRDALADHIGRTLTPEHFYTSCSGYEALDLAARAFLRPNDEILIMGPTFGVYERLAKVQECTIKNVPLLIPDFQADIPALLDAISERTRAVILCNPNNPTGTVMSRELMDELMSNIPEHVLVIADEVYHHFVRDETYPDSIQYVQDGKNIIIVHTFSKAYGMAGMRMGYAIAPPEITSYVRNYYRGFHLNSLQIAAGLAALKDQDHLQKNVNAVLEGRQLLYDRCDHLDLHYWPTQTNFLMVQLPCPAEPIVEAMKYHGVLIRSMGGDYSNCLRISLSSPEANAACADALEAALRTALE